MWEYEFLEEKDEKKLVDRLNAYGKDNWEVCAYSMFPSSMGKTRHFVILKRQK